MGSLIIFQSYTLTLLHSYTPTLSFYKMVKHFKFDY